MPLSAPQISVTIFAALTVFSASHADVTVPAFFSDHAVLQKMEKVPIWGKAESGESVTVTLDKASATAKAGDDGKWKAILDLSSEGPGPYNLVIQGKNQLSFSDVLVGEVWLCGGQSNMDFPLSAFPIAKDEVPNSANPLLRQFKVAKATSATPVDDVKGQWIQAAPDTSGAFSATAYFFGKKIQGELGVPVGLLNDCLGGTMIEPWMSAEALATDPSLKAGAEMAQKNRVAMDNYGTAYAEWQKTYDREDHPVGDPQKFAANGIDTSDWKTVQLPGTLDGVGLPDGGAVWIRKTINVPDADILPGKGIDVSLSDVHDSDQVYWNGKRIGISDVTATAHRYGIHPDLVTEGSSTLAVRIFRPTAGAGIERGKGMRESRFEANHLQLKGDWLAKVETALPPLSAEAKAAFPPKPPAPYDAQNVASYLFNGMINPVLTYGIRGVVWYQGEGNWNHGFQYRIEFPALIRDWRTKWGEGNFPFYFCQIANNHPHPTIPGDDVGAELREAQTLGLAEPNTGEAILIDIGDEWNIHPSDKMDVGDRLARIALANTYGKKVSYSGPTYDSMTVEGDKIRVHFQHTDGGLAAKPMPATYQVTYTDPKTMPVQRNSPDSQLEGFAICGDDHKWVWASARIDGDSVLVSSPQVPTPVAVRYAWAFNPWCNLYNGAGLPAGPFRTDNFTELSASARYGDPTK